LHLHFSGGIARAFAHFTQASLSRRAPIIFALMLLISGRTQQQHSRGTIGIRSRGGPVRAWSRDKVQAILLIGALPLLIMPFVMRKKRQRGRVLEQYKAGLAATRMSSAAIAAVAAAWAAVAADYRPASRVPCSTSAALASRYCWAASASIRRRCWF